MPNPYNPDAFEPDPDTAHWNNVPQSVDLTDPKHCPHDKATVDASLIKHINTDEPERTLGLQLQLSVQAKCAKCGSSFLLSEGFDKVYIPVRIAMTTTEGAFSLN
jgi:hypothetical protein